MINSPVQIGHGIWEGFEEEVACDLGLRTQKDFYTQWQSGFWTEGDREA